MQPDQIQSEDDDNQVGGSEMCFGRTAPQVYDVILVVSPVQMHVVGIDQQEAKQDQQDL